MKSNIIFIALIFFCSHLFGQEFKFPKKIGSSMVEIPGTKMMIDRCEESLGDWFSFVYNKYYDEENSKFKDGFEQVMPDSNLLPKKYAFAIRVFWRLNETRQPSLCHFYGDNSWQYYYLPLFDSELHSGKRESGKAFEKVSLREQLTRILHFPMVGVTYEQVQLYLNWRKEVAQADASVVEKNYAVNARLMTTAEWEKFTNKIGPRLYGNDSARSDSMNALGCYLLNVHVLVPCKTSVMATSMFGSGAVPVYGYFKDHLGLYNMYGNVWEMTQEKGVAVGGSYVEFANRCDALIYLSYTSPQENMGFRCVLEFS